MTKRTKWSLVALTGLIALPSVLTAGCSVVGIQGVEEASYSVLEAEGPFELREYDEVVVVETQVDEDFKRAGRTAFRRLFGYISGDNEAQTKIAMTAPVLADPAATAGSEIAMTAPVLSEEEGDGWRYSFVLPAEFTLATAPLPTDPDVVLAVVPKKRVAALRYSGSWSENAMRYRSDELAEWLAANGLTALSAPRAAGYDPPWTIPFFRRNEVLVDVE